jgi:hypothetical protein
MMTVNPVTPNGENKNPEPVGVVVGDQTLSLQAVQELFREMSGRPVRTEKWYTESFHITFEEIEDLYWKINQVATSYGVVESLFDTSIFYADDTSDGFPSFDELKLRCKTSSSATESMVLTFKFLMLHSVTRKTHNYTVIVRLASRIAVQRRLTSNIFSAPPHVIRMMGDRTAMIEVKYVDSMISRSVISMFDEWARAIPKENRNNFLDFCQRNSHWIPRISKFTAAIIGISAIFIEIPMYISGQNDGLVVFGRFFTFAVGLIFVAYTVSDWLARFMERSIDGMFQISYLDITKGDKIEISRATTENRFRKIISIICGIFSLTSSIIIKILSTLIIKTFFSP